MRAIPAGDTCAERTRILRQGRARDDRGSLDRRTAGHLFCQRGVGEEQVKPVSPPADPEVRERSALRVRLFNAKFSPNLGDGLSCECLERALIECGCAASGTYSVDVAARASYGAGNGSRASLLQALHATPAVLRRSFVVCRSRSVCIAHVPTTGAPGGADPSSRCGNSSRTSISTPDQARRRHPSRGAPAGAPPGWEWARFGGPRRDCSQRSSAPGGVCRRSRAPRSITSTPVRGRAGRARKCPRPRTPDLPSLPREQPRTAWWACRPVRSPAVSSSARSATSSAAIGTPGRRRAPPRRYTIRIFTTEPRDVDSRAVCSRRASDPRAAAPILRRPLPRRRGSVRPARCRRVPPACTDALIPRLRVIALGWTPARASDHVDRIAALVFTAGNATQSLADLPTASGRSRFGLAARRRRERCATSRSSHRAALEPDLKAKARRNGGTTESRSGRSSADVRGLALVTWFRRPRGERVLHRAVATFDARDVYALFEFLTIGEEPVFPHVTFSPARNRARVRLLSLAVLSRPSSSSNSTSPQRAVRAPRGVSPPPHPPVSPISATCQPYPSRAIILLPRPGRARLALAAFFRYLLHAWHLGRAHRARPDIILPFELRARRSSELRRDADSSFRRSRSRSCRSQEKTTTTSPHPSRAVQAHRPRHPAFNECRRAACSSRRPAVETAAPLAGELDVLASSRRDYVPKVRGPSAVFAGCEDFGIASPSARRYR